MNTRAKAVFSLVLVLLLGLLIGGSISYMYLSAFAPPRSQVSLNRRPSNRHFPVQEMIDRLKLSPDQEKQLLEILERRREDMHRAAAEAREAHTAIKVRARKEILDILTEDQAQEFDRFMQELRSRRRQRQEQPPESPPKPPPPPGEPGS